MASPRHTIDASLWDGQRRDVPAVNAATLMFPPRHPRRIAKGSTDAKTLFVSAYAKFAEQCRAFEEPGLAVIAVDEDTCRPAGIVRLTARVQRPVAAIVGRHDHCDLYLTAREDLALRQLAVVLEPVENWTRGSTNIRYRILDLRTTEAMTGEDGKRIRGLVAEGPAIVRCGGYTLFALPLGDPTDWPASGEDAWSMVPARVYLDEIPPDMVRGTLPRMPQERVGASTITRTSGVRDTGMKLVQGDVAGYLELYCPTKNVTLAIGESALKDGVLIGRYDRCDAKDIATDDTSLSRVHALLMRVEDRLLLLDTASSNGTFEKGEQVRVVVIDSDTELRLGKKTYARWRAAK
ncbi:MAG: FHA domain-containing protein [Kofleriaceae bacterium]